MPSNAAADSPVEACLAALLDHLGIAAAHVAARGTGDLGGFIAGNPDRVGSLVLLCSAALDPPTLAPLGDRLLVVTGDTGQFQIVNLVPGTYQVTFTLPGFNSVSRTGVELSGSFAAKIDADLRVGAVEETITVTGESPIVDVQNTRRQRKRFKFAQRPVWAEVLLAACGSAAILGTTAVVNSYPWAPKVIELYAKDNGIPIPPALRTALDKRAAELGVAGLLEQ